MRSIELTVLIIMISEINDAHIAISIVLLQQHKVCNSDETVLIPALILPTRILEIRSTNTVDQTVVGQREL
jgi:hypothetical protein